MAPEGDDMLAEIGARARRKARRRALIAVATIGPGVAIGFIGFFVGEVCLSTAAGVGVSVALAVILEKMLPRESDVD